MMNVNEFWEYSNRPENADRNLDLLHGEVIEWEFPSRRHGFVYAQVGCLLGIYARQIRYGYAATNNVGVILPNPPASVLGPDVTYFTAAIADGKFFTGWDESLPVLAVEVHSLNHVERLERMKILEYLRHDIPLVWYIDCEEKTVSIYCPNGEVSIHGVEDSLALKLVPDSDAIWRDRKISDLQFHVGDLFLLPAERPKQSESAS